MLDQTAIYLESFVEVLAHLPFSMLSSELPLRIVVDVVERSRRELEDLRRMLVSASIF